MVVLWQTIVHLIQLTKSIKYHYQIHLSDMAENLLPTDILGYFKFTFIHSFVGFNLFKIIYAIKLDLIYNILFLTHLHFFISSCIEKNSFVCFHNLKFASKLYSRFILLTSKCFLIPRTVVKVV